MNYRDGWALWVPSLLWITWGAGLGAATIAYYLRRRPACRRGASCPAIAGPGDNENRPVDMSVLGPPGKNVVDGSST